MKQEEVYVVLRGSGRMKVDELDPDLAVVLLPRRDSLRRLVHPEREEVR
jgi:oxalate decarboxylase/phosphoglucose isomerase-like protein (cupin superfamily)